MTWTLLVSLLVKSSLVSGAGLACARFLTRRPVERVDILRATVCLLLALPVIMNVLPALDLALLPASPPPAPLAAPTALATAPVAGMAAPSPSPWPALGLVGGLWLLGFAAIAGRLLLGLRTLSRWTRQGRPVTSGDWLTPLEGLAPEDRPDLVCSDRIASPLSWGVAPGSILVDPASLAQPRAAPAILAHEMAHLRRHDWIFLVLSRLALAIFWFNPLVWRLHAVLAERSEEAADAAAIQTVDRALYARALIGLAACPAPSARPVLGAATAMAADARTLKTRIACLMTDTAARRRPLTVALAIAALAVAATPLAALAVTRQAWVAPPEPPRRPPSRRSPSRPRPRLRPPLPLRPRRHRKRSSWPPSSPRLLRRLRRRPLRPNRRPRRLRLRRAPATAPSAPRRPRKRRPRSRRGPAPPTPAPRRPKPDARPMRSGTRPAAPPTRRAPRPTRPGTTANRLAGSVNRPARRPRARWSRPAPRWPRARCRCARAPSRCAMKPPACVIPPTAPGRSRTTAPGATSSPTPSCAR
jgi:beta-lactamase regulating signal transducer with metallopeptidase domain